MYRWMLSAALLIFVALPALATSLALSLKDVPDEPRATIAKEMARKSAQDTQASDTNSNSHNTSNAASKNSGCTMDIGSSAQPSRNPPLAQRNTIVVITGPVMQTCK